MVERKAAGESANHGDEPSGNLTEDDMKEQLLALVLAGALVAPQAGLASESELNNDAARQAASKFPEKLPLPPIPYLDTMPWMNFGSESQGLGLDTLWLPNFYAPTATKNSASAYNSLWNAESNPNRTATR